MNPKNIGSRANLTSNRNITGLVIGCLNENETSWKYVISLDQMVEIKKYIDSEIVITETKPQYVRLNRLLRDIKSDQIETRQCASDLLCQFVEMEHELVTVNELKSIISPVVKCIKTESDSDTIFKLTESLFEIFDLNVLSDKEYLSLKEDLKSIASRQITQYFSEE